MRPRAGGRSSKVPSKARRLTGSLLVMQTPRGLATVVDGVDYQVEPAEVFGVRGRGRLAPGLAADVTIFDPARVGSTNRGERRFDLPGGAKRMVMPSRGVEYTVVNGAVTWQDGKLTGAAAGQVLRS